MAIDIIARGLAASLRLTSANATNNRTALDLGTIATQNANAVALTGGAINGTTVGVNTPALGVFSFLVVDSGGFAVLNLRGAANQYAGVSFADAAAVDHWLIVENLGAAGAQGNLRFVDMLAGAERFTITTGGAVNPGADNTQNLGSAAVRWATVFAGTGTINTSDERSKRDISAIPDDWLDAWGDVEWCRYKFIDGNRWHTGLVAQQIRDAFVARGLDATKIGLLCFDAWEATPEIAAATDDEGNAKYPAQPARPAGDRWGLRYDECQAIEAAWVRRELGRLLG